MLLIESKLLAGGLLEFTSQYVQLNNYSVDFTEPRWILFQWDLSVLNFDTQTIVASVADEISKYNFILPIITTELLLLNSRMPAVKHEKKNYYETSLKMYKIEPGNLCSQGSIDNETSLFLHLLQRTAQCIIQPAIPQASSGSPKRGTSQCYVRPERSSMSLHAIVWRRVLVSYNWYLWTEPENFSVRVCQPNAINWAGMLLDLHPVNLKQFKR